MLHDDRHGSRNRYYHEHVRGDDRCTAMFFRRKEIALLDSDTVGRKSNLRRRNTEKKIKKRKRFIRRMKYSYVFWLIITAFLMTISEFFFITEYKQNGFYFGYSFIPNNVFPMVFFACMYCPATFIVIYKYTKRLLFNYADKENISFSGKLLNKWKFIRLPYIPISLIVIAFMMVMTIIFFYRTPGYGEVKGLSKIYNIFITGILAYGSMMVIATSTISIMSLIGINGFLKKAWSNLYKYALPFIAFQLLLTLGTGISHAIINALARDDGQTRMLETFSSQILERTYETYSFAGFFRGPLGIVTSLTSISVYDSMFDRIKEIVEGTGGKERDHKGEFIEFWKDSSVQVTLFMSGLCVIITCINVLVPLKNDIWTIIQIILFCAWIYLKILFLKEKSIYDLLFNSVAISFFEQSLFSGFDFSMVPILVGYGILLCIIIVRVILYVFLATGNGYSFLLIRITVPNLKREKRISVEEGLDSSIKDILVSISKRAWKEVKEEEREEKNIIDEIEREKQIVKNPYNNAGERIKACKEIIVMSVHLKKSVIISVATIIGLLLNPLIVIIGWIIALVICKRKNKDDEEGV